MKKRIYSLLLALFFLFSSCVVCADTAPTGPEGSETPSGPSEETNANSQFPSILPEEGGTNASPAAEEPATQTPADEDGASVPPAAEEPTTQTPPAENNDPDPQDEENDVTVLPIEVDVPDGSQNDSGAEGALYTIEWRNAAEGQYVLETLYSWSIEDLRYVGRENIRCLQQPQITLFVENTGSVDLHVQASHRVEGSADWSNGNNQIIPPGGTWTSTCVFALSESCVRSLREGSQSVGTVSVNVVA